MKTSLEINSIFIYSETNDKCFFSEFGNGLNVIYGRNTSGKSTLVQLILYAFGINDNIVKLREILSEEILVRLDCTIEKNGDKKKYTIVRQEGTLLIRDFNSKILRFNGIGGNSSFEHIKLKNYFRELFDFNLFLESKNGIVTAPIETIFLPYYVSQDVGWVYLRNSFSNLNFYKNFKEDFLDYYLGIENVTDREKKREVEKKIRNIEQQIKFLTSVEHNNENLEVSKVFDNSISGKANELIEQISNKKKTMLEYENRYVKESNALTFHVQRLSVVSKVIRNHEKQFPGIDNCPTCTQILPKNIEEVYEFYQEENDTISLKSQLKEKIKGKQATINSLNKKIDSLRIEIEDDYKIFNKYSENKVTLESWIDNKANLQLYDNLVAQVGQLTIDLSTEKDNLKDFKTDDDIIKERNRKNKIFKDEFLKNNISLGLPILEEERFYKLYDISSFPFQGVQLHLAVLSYHFAFNYLLSKTDSIHRLPLMLDSIFEGDVDGKNKTEILKFIKDNNPKDTQCIITIADSKEKNSRIAEYSKEVFKDEAKLICIGEGTKQKALLEDNDGTKKELISDTFDILEEV